MPPEASLTLLCPMLITKGLYGLPFLRQAHELGIRTIVLTHTEALSLDWPRHQLAGLYAVPDLRDATEVRHAVSYLARTERIDRVVGLGEYDVEIAAALREHLQVPGMSLSTSLLFRDKLAMRRRASELGLPVPEFSGIFHRPSLAEFMASTPGPWVLKPRMEASSIGIRKLAEASEVWRLLDELGDRQSHHLLERFLPGRVYHVDSLVEGRRIRFAQAHRYGTPILDLHARGGVYTTCALERGAAEEKTLQELNRKVIEGFGLEYGVTHIEYIQDEQGQFRFLEASARVGSGMIEELIEASRGINLWAEWARLEAARAHGPYRLPELRSDYAGVAIVMLGQEYPDVAFLGDHPYVRPLVPKPYHAATLVVGPDAREVERLIEQKAAQIGQAFLGIAV